MHENILTTSGYRNQIYFQTMHWRWYASKCCINIFLLQYYTLTSISIFYHLSLNSRSSRSTKVKVKANHIF